MSKNKTIIMIAALVLMLSVLVSCNNVQTTPTEQPTQEEPTITPTLEPTPTTAPERIDIPLNLHHYSEYFSPILGLCEDYPTARSTAEEIEKDFSLMNQYGISDLRVSIAWGDYERIKDFHDWTYLDRKMELANQYGIELYPYIAYSPSWATGGSWKTPPQDLDDWYEFVYKVVDRYKDQVTYWELWNEGDNADFWDGTWNEQLELVKVGAMAVKDADPTAKTIFGGLTNKTPGHVNTIYTSGVDEFIDIINIHYYYETWNNSPTENMYEVTMYVADVIRRYGGKQELWVAEVGYSDYVQEDGSISDWASIREPYEKTQHFQGVTFVRSFTRLMATEDVSNVLWYEIKNLKLNSPAIGDVNNHFLGALDQEHFPKHLWFAIAQTKELFDAPFKSIDDTIIVDSTNAQKPYVHAFERENGDVILMAWNRGAINESVEITLPGKFANAIRYSVTGEKENFIYNTNDDTITFTLDLVPENTNIIELFSEDIPDRLTIHSPVVSSVNATTYNISATLENIGNDDSINLTGELFINNALESSDSLIIEIDELAAGEKTTVSWTISRTDNSEITPKAWIAVNPNSSPAAAILIELN